MGVGSGGQVGRGPPGFSYMVFFGIFLLFFGLFRCFPPPGRGLIVLFFDLLFR